MVDEINISIRNYMAKMTITDWEQINVHNFLIHFLLLIVLDCHTLSPQLIFHPSPCSWTFVFHMFTNAHDCLVSLWLAEEKVMLSLPLRACGQYCSLSCHACKSPCFPVKNLLYNSFNLQISINQISVLQLSEVQKTVILYSKSVLSI